MHGAEQHGRDSHNIPIIKNGKETGTDEHPASKSGLEADIRPYTYPDLLAVRLQAVKECIISDDPSVRKYRKDTIDSIDFNSKFTAPNDTIRGVSSLHDGTEKLLDELGIRLTGDDRDKEIDELLVDIVNFIAEKKGVLR